MNTCPIPATLSDALAIYYVYVLLVFWVVFVFISAVFVEELTCLCLQGLPVAIFVPPLALYSCLTDIMVGNKWSIC